MTHTTYAMKFRRRREKKTNYVKRLAMAKSGKARLVVRKTNKYVYMQVIAYNRNGDKIIAQANSKELAKMGWKRAKRNTPAAYLTGMLCAERAKGKKVEECILDIGFNTSVSGGICFAALKGAIDAGMKIPFEQKAIPKDERIYGSHMGKDVKQEIEKLKQEIARVK